MKRPLYILLSILSVCMFIACNKDEFDEKIYRETLTRLFPADNVSSSQDWHTVESGSYNVALNFGDSATYHVKIYTANPLDAYSDTLLAEQIVKDGGTASGIFSYAISSPYVYVACYNSEGLMAFRKCDITSQAVSTTMTSNLPFYPSSLVKEVDPIYTFCFEDSYPQPDDFDYNDLVLHVKIHRDISNLRHIRMTVSLEAVGTSVQMAAVIRLMGIAPSEVDSIVRTSTFLGEKNGDQWQWTGKLLSQSDVWNTNNYFTGKYDGTKTVILPLFNDAHCALSGYINQIPYNVSLRYSREYKPTHVIFDLYLKDVDRAAALVNPNNLDVFALYGSGVSAIEIHTYDYKNDVVLYDRKSLDTGHFTWALMIPGKFEYPLNGRPITVKESARTEPDSLGNVVPVAYPYFPNWAASPGSHTDWYKINDYAVVHRVYDE